MAMALSTELRGRVWRFGDNVCGDDGIIDFEIVRQGFGKPLDEAALKEMCFRRLRPEFPEEVRPGDIVVAGTNFAHHNHIEVSVALKASGLAAILAESCEAGFIRRALNVGLPVVTCPGVTGLAGDGEEILVDPAAGIVAAPDGRTLRFAPFSPHMVAVWQSGGIVPFLQREVAATRNTMPSVSEHRS